jgi:Heavy metal binding domain
MRTLTVAITIVLGLAAPAWAQVELIPRTGALLATQSPDDETGFVCPMHPDIMSHEPGKCPRCGMDLAPGNPLMASDFKLTVDATPAVIKPGQPVRFRFTAAHPLTGQKVSSYAIVHDKPYHLFVISRDMEFFEHLHPTQDKDGSFHLDVTLPKPGRYLLLSDFFPEGGGPQVISTHIATAGYDADVVSTIPKLVPETVFDRTANGVRAQMMVEAKDLIAGEDLDLPIHFEDAKTGAPITDLQRYLGAFGHMLIMSEDMLDYVHSHPEEQLEGTTITSGGGPEIKFHALFPKPGRYRVWLQYQRAEVLSTVSFTIAVSRFGETQAMR